MGKMLQTRIDVYISHTPAGTSTKNMIHFAQGVKSGKFQVFLRGFGTGIERKIYQ